MLMLMWSARGLTAGSFLLRKSTGVHKRRAAKLVSTLTSLFTSSYVFHWTEYFPETRLRYPPCFDGRVVLYPGEREVKDYFAWRQADGGLCALLGVVCVGALTLLVPAHVNNLYNTVFWALVQEGRETTAGAHARLQGTVASEKQEMLFARFGVNYNAVGARFRKGSVVVRGEGVQHCDVIGGGFWESRAGLLSK
jgi:tRNA(His) guanylyltransferase